VKPGSDTPITIKIRRKDGVKAGVTITAVRLANNTITTRGVFVAPEKDEGRSVECAEGREGWLAPGRDHQRPDARE
jgi:hypothetical protein